MPFLISLHVGVIVICFERNDSSSGSWVVPRVSGLSQLWYQAVVEFITGAFSRIRYVAIAVVPIGKSARRKPASERNS